jgi:hypothetical protein
MSACPWNLSEPFSQAFLTGALTLEEASLLEDWEIADLEPPESLDQALNRLYLWTLLVRSPLQ